MKSSFFIILIFLAGFFAGWAGILPDAVAGNRLSEYALYLLIFLAGMGIGCEGKLKESIKTLQPRIALIPLATIVGTLLFSALAAFFVSGFNIWDCMAIGSGFAYYSLSSILLMQIKSPEIGTQLAAQLGAVALFANIIRELATLIGAPLFVRLFGKYAPICCGGATTMDTTLPAVIRYSGKEMAVVAVLHGIVIDFSVPFFVSFFASL